MFIASTYDTQHFFNILKLNCMRRIAVITLIIISACAEKNKPTPEEIRAYQKEIDDWHTKRIENVSAPNGWLNLAGLYWLEPGINTFGSSTKNKIVFPEGKIAEEAGYFLVNGSRVDIYVRQGVDITTDGKRVTQQTIYTADSTPVVLTSGSLRWNVIKRDDKLGIRLRDDKSVTQTKFAGIDRYPIDPLYKVEARFVKADSSRTIDVTNVLGQTHAQHSPGTLLFELKGNEYRLDVLEGGRDEFFIIIADQTSGKETYGGGRFLYVKHPDANNKVILDFNKAYNPPCVFTPYATCPLPPHQNVLDIAIQAGEKNYSADHKPLAKDQS
jgi:uncharacterized protein